MERRLLTQRGEDVAFIGPEARIKNVECRSTMCQETFEAPADAARAVAWVSQELSAGSTNEPGEMTRDGDRATFVNVVAFAEGERSPTDVDATRKHRDATIAQWRAAVAANEKIPVTLPPSP